MKLIRLLAGCPLALATSLAGAQTWELIDSVPTSGVSREFAAGITLGQTIVALGGKPLTTAGEGDGVVHALVDGSWYAPPHLDGEGPLIRQGAGVDDLGRIIFFGGVREGDGEPGHARVYDLVLGVRPSIAPRGASAPDDYFAFTTDDLGRIYSIGGSAFNGIGTSAYVERYSGSLNTWQPVAPMVTAVRDAAAAFDEAGHILVIGGYGTNNQLTTNVAQFDIATGTWSNTAVADIPVAVAGARAVRGADGLIYLLGGRSGPLGPPTELRTWIYRAQTNTWSPGPNMAVPRSHFAATLGQDSYIYVVGGSNDSGGTDQCERLYTPVCPQIVVQPHSASAWNGGAARFTITATGGSPMSYQWRLNGIALTDGPTISGSVISGSDSASLTISSVSSADNGSYDVIASNPCGSATSASAGITLRYPPTPQSQWQAINLHPAWVDGSSGASAIENARIGGYGDMTTLLPDGRTFVLDHPILWDINLDATDITPPGSVGGAVFDIGGDFLVGWFYHTWQCWGGSQMWTCAWQSAGFWSGDPPVFQERHMSGSEYDAIYMTDGISMVGSATYDGSGGVHYSVATLHMPPNYWAFVLNSPNASSTSLSAVDGANQYGTINTQQPGAVAHAARWSNNGASMTDLHPAGYTRSYLSHAGNGQAVGSAYVGDTSHAGLWADGDFFDLNPPGATYSTLSVVHEGIQAGAADGMPGFWFGSSSSFLPLNSLVPPGFTSAWIADFEIAPDGAITMVGGGLNSATGRNEALLWRPQVACPGDTNGDGQVNLSDLSALLAHFGNASGATLADGDVDGDGDVDLSDLSFVLANFGSACL